MADFRGARILCSRILRCGSALPSQPSTASFGSPFTEAAIKDASTYKTSVAGSGPVPVLSIFFGGLRTEDRTGPTPQTRTGTETAVLRGLNRTAVQSSVRTSPGLESGPDQSWTGPMQSRTSPRALGRHVATISFSSFIRFT